MAKVLWVLVLAAIACQVRGFGIPDLVSNSDDEDSSKCPDGLYNNPKNCSTFIQCSNGVEHVMPCPKGLHYSTRTERCERPCDARCDRTYSCRCGWQTCDSQICYLPNKAGPCNQTSERYYFDKRTAKCVTFTYGGCRGNENNFQTKKECEKTCSDSIDICRLPKETGPCDGHFEKYFFNRKTGQCEKFVYGGCRGNPNRFDSMEQCEQKCLRKMDEDINICRLPKETGPCDGHFEKYFFNHQTGQCEKFVYGGCRGNRNNFDSREQCELKCLRRKAPEESCTLPAETGNCKARIPRYFYDKNTGLCTPFVYGGCDGNANNFETKSKCEEKCGETVDVCQLSKETGPCQGSFRRWWFNPEAKKCEQFVYGGCRGNGNNFDTEAECEKRCPSSGSVVDRVYSGAEPECESPPEVGPCKGNIPRYYYDQKTKKCTKFTYGGCGGNGNNYETINECQAQCWKKSVVVQHSDIEPECNSPPEVGPCKGNIPRYYYDKKTKKCTKFTYGGCGGNGNNYETINECFALCFEEESVVLESNLPEYCELEPETGPCRANITKFYYDHEEKECKEFQYGGCRGNRNNFYSKELCERRCKDKDNKEKESAARDALPEYCEGEPETGPCRANMIMFYYNEEEKECKEFRYGGCLGNRNRFNSKELCERKCKDKDYDFPEEVKSAAWDALPEYCELEPVTGPCHANITKFYYDHEEGECKEFQYGGCGGNRNSFYSKEMCERRCKSKKESDENELELECHSEPETGPCKANILRWYYDQKKGQCLNFFYGGCQGNGNNYRTQSECQEKCAVQSSDLRCPDFNGDFSLPRRCNMFIRCRHNVPELEECPSGQLFDFLTKQCVEAEKAHCLL